MHPLFSFHQPYFTPNWVNFPRVPRKSVCEFSQEEIESDFIDFTPRNALLLQILSTPFASHSLSLRFARYFVGQTHKQHRASKSRIDFPYPPLPAGGIHRFFAIFSFEFAIFKNSREMLTGNIWVSPFRSTSVPPAKRIAIVCLFPPLRATRHLTRISLLVHRIISRLSIFFSFFLKSAIFVYFQL